MRAKLGLLCLGLSLPFMRRRVLLLQPDLLLLPQGLLAVALRHRLLPFRLRRHRAVPRFPEIGRVGSQEKRRRIRRNGHILAAGATLPADSACKSGPTATV